MAMIEDNFHAVTSLCKNFTVKYYFPSPDFPDFSIFVSVCGPEI